MKRLTTLAATTILLMLAGQLPVFGKSLPNLTPENKIDRMVKQSMTARESIPVTILCKTQFLQMPGGFAEFCAENAGRNRDDLRREVIRELKSIADNGEQDAVKRVTGRVRGEQHWIINALSLRLTASQIRKVAKLDEVKYVYAGFPALPRHRNVRLAEILSNTPRKPPNLSAVRVPWNLKAIHAERVWRDKGIFGESVVVAMLEGGVDYTHQDLRDNIWINQDEIPNNGKDDDGNGWIDDYYGYNFRTGSNEVIAKTAQHHHGTMTSGIVAGDGTGGIITGVAPRARIMPLSGHAVYAYEYALEEGADILSMSFSVPNQGNARGLWRLMSEQAVCAGLVLVSGCGNFQQTETIPEQIRVPEGIPCVIGAGGLTRTMEVPLFCSLGPVEWGTVKFYEDFPMPAGLMKPDVSAFPGPGYPQLAPNNGNYIQNKRGNSFSAPHLAGVAALMLSAAPQLPAWKIKDLLEATARDLGANGKDNQTGAGLVDAWMAVAAAQQAVPTTTVKGIYGNPKSLWDQQGDLRKFGINAVFVRHKVITDDLMAMAQSQGINVYAEFATLNGKNYVEQHPEAWAINQKGEQVEYASWFMGVCPTEPGFRQYRMDELRELLTNHDIGGVWMDYVHWHAQFEEPEPVLPETCFCNHCLDTFTATTGIAPPEGDTPSKARWILRHHESAWRDWRCRIIVDWANGMRAIIGEIRPGALLGLYHCPWDDDEFGGARRRILGLDLDMLRGPIDVFSPMVYHERMGREPDWVRRNVQWLCERLNISKNSYPKVWPIVQAQNKTRAISADEFETVLRHGLSGNSTGVMMFTANAIADEAEKRGVMQTVYTSPKR